MAKTLQILALALTVLASLPAFAQEHIVVFDGNGHGIYADSARMKALESRILTSKATTEGLNLQKSAGLDAPKLSPQLAPEKLDANGFNPMQYRDTIINSHPDFNMPQQYAITGNKPSDMEWQRSPQVYDFSRDGKIARWDGGYITGYSGQQTIPMLESARWAGAQITQNFGERWQATLGMSAQKLNLPSSVYNTFGFDGQLMYTFSPTAQFTAFGIYQSSPFFSQSSSARSTINYGGYFTLRTNNNKWGVDLGAQSFYDVGARRNAVVPIIRPFYNYHGQKLGIDLGGLLYQIFQSASIKVNGGGPEMAVPANMRPAPAHMIMVAPNQQAVPRIPKPR